MKAARQAWFETLPDLDPDTHVFLDETAAATNMPRRYGCAPRGSRCRLLAPQGHYKTTTVTAALRSTGLCALSLIDGATNGARFRSYVTDHLVPVLRPGDTVILDNLQAHKVAGVREVIEAVGARVLYLPSTIRIFEGLRGLGYKGGYDAVRRYARGWTRERTAFTAQAFVPLVFAPGEAYQFDWSHKFVLVGDTGVNMV